MESGPSNEFLTQLPYIIDVPIGIAMVLIGVCLVRYSKRIASIASAPYRKFGLTSGKFTFAQALWGSRVSGAIWIMLGILFIFGVINV